MIIGIDPGPTTSGLIVISSSLRVTHASASATHAEVIAEITRSQYVEAVACEWLTSYGSAVGASVLDTARMVGRYEQAAHARGLGLSLRLRATVCARLTGQARATDAQLHEAVRAIYRARGLATGGGADPCRGIASRPGPLLAVRSHAWDALAVALAWLLEEEG